MELTRDLTKKESALDATSRKEIGKPGKFLVDNGLLFTINRELLHPLGLALCVHLDDNDNTVKMTIWDCRGDPEGIIFENGSFIEGLSKYTKYMNSVGYNFMNTRQALLGFSVQGR